MRRSYYDPVGDVLRCRRCLPTGRAPSHTGGTTRALLGEMFRETVAWPALSLGVFPNDNALWGSWESLVAQENPTDATTRTRSRHQDPRDGHWWPDQAHDLALHGSLSPLLCYRRRLHRCFTVLNCLSSTNARRQWCPHRLTARDSRRICFCYLVFSQLFPRDVSSHSFTISQIKSSLRCPTYQIDPGVSFSKIGPNYQCDPHFSFSDIRRRNKATSL